MAAAEVDRVFGDPPTPVIVECFTRVRVHIKPWEVAARDIQADPVAALNSRSARPASADIEVTGTSATRDGEI